MSGVVIQGNLTLFKKSANQVRFFRLTKDGLNYYKAKEDADAGGDPRGTLKKGDMEGAELDGDKLLLKLVGNQSLKLGGSEEEGDESPPVQAWLEALAELGIGAKAEAAAEAPAGKAEGGAEAAAPAEAAEEPPVAERKSSPRPSAKRQQSTVSSVSRKSATDASGKAKAKSRPSVKKEKSALGDAPAAGQAADDADAAAPASPPRSPRGPPLVEGELAIVKKKGEDTRYFVMHDKCLEYYGSKEDFQNQEMARGKMLFKDLSGVELIAEGSLMSISIEDKPNQPLRLRAPDAETFERWSDKWTSALQDKVSKVAGVDTPDTAAPASPSPDSPAASSVDREGSVPQTPEGTASMRSALSTGASRERRRSSGRGSVTFGDAEVLSLPLQFKDEEEESTKNFTKDAGRTPPAAASSPDSSPGSSQASSPKAEEADEAEAEAAAARKPAKSADDSSLGRANSRASRLKASSDKQTAGKEWAPAVGRKPPPPPPKVAPKVSQEEKDKVKGLKAWVRPGPPPKIRGVFDMERDGNGLVMAKYIEIFEDGLMFFDAPADTKGHSSPFAPEGMIATRDMVSIEPLDDGFQLLCADDTKVIFRGPTNAAAAPLDKFVDLLGTQIQSGGGERGAKVRRADPEQVLVQCNVLRVLPRTSKLFPAEGLLSPVTFSLTPIEDEASTDTDGPPAPPECDIDVKDIKEVKMTVRGFFVETMYHTREEVVVPDDGDREEWKNAWDSLLVDGFEKPSDAHWRRREVRRLYACNVQRVHIDPEEGEEEPEDVYATVWTDRLDIHPNKEAAQSRQDPISQTWPSQVRMVRAHDDGVRVNAEDPVGDNDYRAPRENVDHLYEAMKTCFSRMPMRSQAEIERAISIRRNRRNIEDLPLSADPDCVSKTMRDEDPEEARAICQGRMGFYNQGKLKMRYAILYPDRLNAWDGPENVMADEPPVVNMKLDDINSLDRVEKGLIMSMLQPAEKKVGVYVGDDEELNAWEQKLGEAIQKRKEPKGDAGDAIGRVPVQFPKRAPPGFVPKCANVIPRGRLATEKSFTQPKVIVSSRSMHPSRHVIPDSHMTKKKGIHINTHRAGWQAHGLVERAKVSNPADMLNKPSPRPQAPDKGDKISNHADSKVLVPPRYSMCQGLAVTPNGIHRSIPREPEVGHCPWQKVNGEPRSRSVSPSRGADAWHKIGSPRN